MKNTVQNEEINQFPADSVFSAGGDFGGTRDLKARLLALKIEEAIKEKGLTRQSFALKMEVQPSIVTRWLSGSHNFTLATLFDIEDKLGIKLIAVDTPVVKSLDFHMKVTSPKTQFDNAQDLMDFVGKIRQPQYYGGDISSEDAFAKLSSGRDSSPTTTNDK